jgi:hypothetical protein
VKKLGLVAICASVTFGLLLLASPAFADDYSGWDAIRPLLKAEEMYSPSNKGHNTKYYWRIIAKDNHEASTFGPLWDFTTQAPVGVTWNCPLGGQPLIAPYPGAGRPFLSVPADCAGITASAGAALWGIYHLVETGPGAGTWLWYIPGFVTSTLTQLEAGEYYWVVVSAPCTLTVPQEPPTLSKAYQHLAEVMDRFHQSLDVYTDVGAAGNHFVHRAKMSSQGDEDAVTIDDASTENPYSGATCIKNTFSARGLNWGGWYFQNGVLLADDVKPRGNWGDYPDAGYDLSGATKLTFWARGAQGGERVEFFAFGVGRDPDTGVPIEPYPDSSAKVTLCGLLASPCYVTLEPTWRLYTINLTGLDLSYVIGGFGWVTNALENNNQSIIFYLDDIRYDKPRLDDLRFLVSYETIPSAQDFDTVLRNVAFTYDNALALIAFTDAGDWGRARMLADAFVYAQKHDRYYSDGRLRNAYQAGDLIIAPGWTPNNHVGTCRMPGWWNEAEQEWYEDKEFVGSSTGNLAWAMIALLNYYEERGGEQYLTAAITLGNWIETHTRDTRGAGGYTGGYIGWEPTPTKLLWKSTEHNLDIYVVFERLHDVTGEPKWHERAQHAQNFVEAMWNEEESFYWTGTLEDGVTVNTQAIPLDCQTWSLLAFSPNERTRQAIAYAETHHYATYGGYEGFDFNTDRDMPWFEGTAQMVVAYWTLTNPNQAQFYLEELREVQATAPNGNGKGIVAAPCDGLTTGFDWSYFNRLHVGATAWYIFAERHYNPYWGK